MLHVNQPKKAILGFGAGGLGVKGAWFGTNSLSLIELLPLVFLAGLQQTKRTISQLVPAVQLNQ